MRGAGGTSGGTGRFVLGLIMIVAGGYLFLDNITVRSGFGLGYGLYTFGLGSWNMRLTSGMVLIPFIFGIGYIFYNSKSLIGWVLAGASLVMLTVGVITSIHLTMKHMSAFDILTILVLLFGGVGMFLSSLREAKP
ncbi:Putative uncharacterized membrane protein [Desulfatibacillum aliphaticivorans]|uniref:Uncharacterized membrane protein n=1 Tax=Desulfatibacillum aliphaticivorans TaxID=218208 RepID=B8FFJ5_DESAL|nr:hypothetical protein [Desulfatibacillum aliphaticivorans]ACL04255.1 Putative uncharacterized membrane protein [Desulfatibacillum aliphaticivorans]